ncbi:hypothetical protein P8452_29819 [Trifolium repens]|nr:hypothetical protein P8452_29819 [Trifolium repens]
MADFQRQQQQQMNQQMINQDVALLVQRRFRAEIFTVTTSTELLGSENGKFWISPKTCELGQLVRFVGWLKTREGRNAGMIRGMRVAAQSLEKILRGPYN